MYHRRFAYIRRFSRAISANLVDDGVPRNSRDSREEMADPAVGKRPGGHVDWEGSRDSLRATITFVRRF